MSFFDRVWVVKGSSMESTRPQQETSSKTSGRGRGESTTWAWNQCSCCQTYRYKEPASSRNACQVIVKMPYRFCFNNQLIYLISILQSQEYCSSPVSQTPSSASLRPSKSLSSNFSMKTINSEMVQWLIAKKGTNFADSDNLEVATVIITNIIFW